MNLRRKRMILMRDVWYGYNRTASGNPVTLEAAKRLRQLTIYGNTIQRNLPEGYTQVEYLQSTGTQWIVTDITSDQDTGIYLEAAFDELLPAGSHDTSGYRLIGCVNNNFGIGEHPSKGEFNFMRKNGTGATDNCDIGVTADTAKHTFKNNYLNDGLFVVDDTEKTAPEATFTNNYGMAIFRTTYNSVTNYYNTPCKAKIYRIKISQGAEVVHDIFPCTRDSDSKPGMYDTLTDTFMTNAGTGEFTAGAEVTEPSPDNPIDVQLCGDRTGNLLDYNRLWDEVYYAGNFKCTKLYLKPNTQYTLSTNIPLSDARYAGVYLSTNDTYISGDNSPASVNIPATVETDNSGLLVAIVRYSGTSLIIPSEEDFKNGTYWVMLNEGSEAQPYEPYGYKVSGRVEGVNLFDKDNATLGYRLTQDGVLHNNDGAGRNSFVSDYISVDPNTIYSLNYAITTLESTGYERVCFYDADKQFISLATVGVHTLTTPENASYLRLCRLQTHLDDTMLLKGSYTADTIPPYEPYQPPQDFAVYLPHQIAKVGDVADTVVLDMEKRTATLVQRTKEIVFDGTENWIASVNISNIREFKLYIDSIFRSNYVYCFSNRYKVAYDTKDHCTYMAKNNPVLLHIADNSFTTAAEFKAWLSELYASGEPLKYLFELATPVTTNITAMQDWDAMPQVKGTVTLTLSAEVEPSGAEAVYYSAERGD